MRHDHLRFDRNAGRAAFRREVNLILSRGQAMYELLPKGEVHRTGTPEVQDVLQRLYPASGDARFDELIDEARALYASHREGDRARALERLWDGFERLNTIDLPGPDKKKQSVRVLLSNFTAGWDSVIEAEMSALTQIGNDFQIRHFESSKTALPDGAADHLFARLGALITELLRASNRLATPPDDRPAAWPPSF